MSAIYGYVGLTTGMVGTDLQEAAASEQEVQRRTLRSYAVQHDLQITDFIEFSGARSTVQTRMELLHARLKAGDHLLVAELRKLGSNIGEVIVLLDGLVAAGVAVTVIEPRLHLSHSNEDAAALAARNMLSLLAQAEKQYRLQRSQRIATAQRAKGGALGKPKGTIQESMYDKDRGRIQELLLLGVSQRQIVERHLGYGTSNSLNHYIRTRGLLRPTGQPPAQAPAADPPTKRVKENDLVDYDSNANEGPTRR